jgi:hypothetical protein
MKQTFLKASYNIGWASSDYRVALGGEGAGTTFIGGRENCAQVVVPVAGTFRHLVVYSPAGSHPNYDFTLLLNNTPSALTCHLDAAAMVASDRTHAVAVAVGDDVSFSVTVNPFGVGAGYPVAFSVEFEGAQQFYALTAITGNQTGGTYNTGGALGNGVQQVASFPTLLSNSFSICTTAGVVTGLRMQTFAGPTGTNSYTAFLSKNQVLQDGAGGTVNTACVLTGSALQHASLFALPLAVGDHLDFALLYTGTTAPAALAQVTLSLTFQPADPDAFMNCGGSNDTTSATAVDWKWVHSEQLAVSEAVAQVPTGPRPLVITGLYVDVGTPPGVGTSRVIVLRKNGIDTAATLTITGTATTGGLTGVSVPYQDDLIDLQITPIGTPLTGTFHWGLSLAPPPPIPPPPPGTIDPIRRLRQAPVLWDGAEGKRLKFPGFELLTEAGGPRDTDVAMPIVLQWSDDGGHSWGHEHRNEGARIGEHRYRYRWLRLGQARNRVFRVVCSADAKVVFIDALLSPDPVQGSS